MWPVVAAALSFNPDNMPSEEFLDTLNDSKKITEKKRDILFKELIEMSRWDNPSIYFGMWVVDNYVIDEINIKQANREAMRRALEEILRKIPKEEVRTVAIDGNDNYTFDELDKKPLFIVWWDWKVTEISWASIIAKVFRDNLIKTYAELYPDFGLEWHKGYGTKKHREYLSDKSKVTSIHRKSYKPVKEVLTRKPKLLLHICCWPDATIPIVDMKDKYDITCFWYDPNIQPKQEYLKRLDAFKKVCEIEDVPYIEGEYDVPNFFRAIKWLENTPEKWEKCTKCYDMRIEKSAMLARELWIDNYTTTLNISPHKDLDKLFKIGDKYWEIYDLDFLKIAFRKNKWFERSVEYTKKHDIYRQNYCGCIYSDTFPEEYLKAKKKINNK